MNKITNFNFGVIVPKVRKMNKTLKKFFPVTKQAFTLVEILIVVGIVGILFITLVPRIDFAGDRARETGVKTDFRAFSLASEQLLRENAGIAKHDTLAKLCAADAGINLYLDPALQFETTGISKKTDPWNNAYTIQVTKPTSGGGSNVNNGVIVVVSNGKDSSLSADTDNYATASVFIDGKIETATTGFSSNIESASIGDIAAAASESMTVSSGVATVRYKK